MTRPDPTLPRRKFYRSRRSRLIGASSAGVILWSLASAASALPTGGVVFDSTPGPATTITPGSGTLTVDQGGDRVVIDWSTFNIASGETVTFNQPDAGAIAFNRVDPSAFTTIDGNLNSNGGVWLFSPGGLLFGANAQVNVGSFVGSTAQLQDANVAAALTGDTVTASALASNNGSTLTVAAGADLTATDGYMVLLGETIVQNGTVVSSNDSVWYGVAEAGAITTNTSGPSPTLTSVDVSAVAGRGRPAFTQGATGSSTGQGVGISTPGAVETGWQTVINLGGSTSATGTVANTANGVVVLTGAVGAVDLTVGDVHLDTTGGTINTVYGLYVGVTSATLGGDITGPFPSSYIHTYGDLTLSGDIYGSVVRLRSDAGDITITGTGSIDAGHFAAGGVLQISAYYGDVTIADGAVVSSLSDAIILAGEDLTIAGDVSATGAGSNSTALFLASGDLTITATGSLYSQETVLASVNGAMSVAGTIEGVGAVTLYNSDATVTSTGVVQTDGTLTFRSFQGTGELTVDGVFDSVVATNITSTQDSSLLTINGAGTITSDGDVYVGSAGGVVMYGAIDAADLVTIYADSDAYIGGTVTGAYIDVTAGGTLEVSGSLTASDRIDAAGDYVHLTGTGTIEVGTPITATNALINITGSYVVTDAGSLITTAAGDYLAFLQIYADAGAGATAIRLAGDIYSGSVIIGTTSQSDIYLAGGQIEGLGVVNIYASGSLTTDAADIDSDTGQIQLVAAGDINIGAGTTLHAAYVTFELSPLAADGSQIVIDGDVNAVDAISIYNPVGDVTLGSSGSLHGNTDASPDNGGPLGFQYDTIEIRGENIYLEDGSSITVGNAGDPYRGTLYIGSIDSGGGETYVSLGGYIQVEAMDVYVADGSLDLSGNIYTLGSLSFDLTGEFTGDGSGRVHTSGYFNVTAYDGVDFSGYLRAQGDVAFTTTGTDADVNLGGVIIAYDDITVTATGDINIADYATLRSDANNYGSGDIGLYADGRVTTGVYSYLIAGSQSTPTGDVVIVAGGADVDGTPIDLHGYIYAYGLGLVASYGSISLADGDIRVVDSLSIYSAYDFTMNTPAEIHSGGDVSITSNGAMSVNGSIYADGYISLTRQAYGDYDVTVGGFLHADGDVSVTNQGDGDVIIAGGTILANADGVGSDDGIYIVSQGTIYGPGGVLQVGTSPTTQQGQVSLHAYGADDGNSAIDIALNIYATSLSLDADGGSINLAGGTISVINSLYINSYYDFSMDASAAIYSDGAVYISAYGELTVNGVIDAYSINLYRYDGGTADLTVGGDLTTTAGINIVNQGNGDVILSGNIIADADADAAAGYIYISSEGAVVATGGLLQVGSSIYNLTGPININAGGDSVNGYAIDLSADINADSLTLNADSGSIRIGDGTINLNGSFDATAPASFIMDYNALINASGANISADASITVNGRIYTYGDIYLTRTGAYDGDISVGGRLNTLGSIYISNNGPGDVNLSGGVIVANVDDSGTDGITISSQGQVVAQGGVLQVGSAPDAHSGDITITAYGADGAYSAIDLDMLIYANALTLTTDGGSIHLAGGAVVDVDADLTLYSSEDVIIDTAVDIHTDGDLSMTAGGSLDASGALSAGGDVYLTLLGSSTSDLTVNDVTAQGSVTIDNNGTGNVLIADGAQIAADTDGLDGFGVYITSEGQVISGAGSAITVGTTSTPTGVVEITANGDDGGGYSALDLSGDITAAAVTLSAPNGSIHLAGGEIYATDGVDFTVGQDFLMDEGATLTAYGSDFDLYVDGDISLGGVITADAVSIVSTGDADPSGTLIDINGDIYGRTISIINQGGDVDIGADAYFSAYYSSGGPAIYIAASDNLTMDGVLDAQDSVELRTTGAGGLLSVGGDIDAIGIVIDAVSDIDIQGALASRAGISITSYDIGGGPGDINIGGSLDSDGGIAIIARNDGAVITFEADAYAATHYQYAYFTGPTHGDPTALMGQDGDIYIYSAGQVVTVAGSVLDATQGAGADAGLVVIRANGVDGPTTSAVDLHGDIISYETNIYADNGSIHLAEGTISVTDAFYASAADGFSIDAGAVIDGTTGGPADIDIYAGGDIDLAGSISGYYVHIQTDGAFDGAADIDVSGYVYATDQIELFNFADDIHIGATGELYVGSPQENSRPEIFVQAGGLLSTDAGSYIHTELGSNGYISLRSAGNAGTVIDLAGDVVSGGDIDIRVSGDGDLQISGGTITAADDITVTAYGQVQVTGGVIDADDTVSFESGGDMLLAGDVYGLHIRANIYGGESSFAVDGASITVDGNLYADQTIEINDGVGDVVINGQVIGNLGEYTSQSFQAHFVQIYGENITTGAGSLIASGPDGARLGDVVLGTYNYYGDPTLVDLSGDIDAQAIIFDIQNGSLRQRAGAVSAANPITIDVDGYFQTDDGASIYSGGDVRVTSQDGMIVNGDITADRIFLTDYSASDLVVGGTLLTGSDINIRSVYDDVHLTADALLFADTDYYAPDPVYNHVYLEAGGQVRTDAGSSIQVGSLADPHGTVEITAHGLDGPIYSAADLSGDISAYTVDIIADAGSIRLRDGDIAAVADVDFAAGRSFLMGADATLYSQGDASLSGVDGVLVGGTVTALGNINVEKLTASAGAVTVSGQLYAGEDIDIVNNGAGDVILGGATIVADSDGVAGTNSVYISAENGQVVLSGNGVIRVGAEGYEHGAIGIHAGGADSADFSSIDIAMDLTADNLTLTTDQGSIHLASGADIVVANDLTITSQLDILADAGSTITTDGDATLLAGRSLYALGDITSGGDILLQIGAPVIIGPGPGPGNPAGFTAQPGDLVVGGAVTADGTVDINNFDGGDIYVDGTAAIRSDADNLGAGDGVSIFGYGQVITAAGSTINAGAPGAPTAGVSIYAGGDDGGGYSAIDLSGDIEGASLSLYTQGSIRLRDGDIIVTGDLFIGTYVDFLMEAPASIDAGGDVTIVAVNSLVSQGDITSGGDIYLHLDPAFYLYSGFTAGPGDLVVGGNVNADGSIDIVNDGSGDIYIDGTAALTADADSTGGPDHIAIDSYGQVISASGSSMVVGAPGATTGDVSIVAAGLDGGGYSAITLGGDIDANGLTLDADAGSIHLTNGTITVTDDLVLTSALDVITEDTAVIEAGADVSITAGRTLTVRGDIDAAGAIALALTGASTSDLTVAGILYADDGISVINDGTGDVVLDDGSMLWADFDGDASGDIYLSSNGSVITSDQGSNGSEATIIVGGVGAPTGDVTIVADGAGVAIDLSGDIQAQNLFLTAANGSIYLRNGDIDLTNGLTIDSDFNVLMNSSATIDSGGDVAMTAAGFLTVNGSIHADGDITLLLDASNQDLSVGGLLAAGGDINIDNTGLGDVLMSPSTSMFANGLIDVTAGGDIVLDGFIDSATTFNADAGDDLTFSGQVQAGTGATLHSDYDMTLNGIMIVEGYNDFVATAGATLTQNSGASIQAGGYASFQSGSDMVINGTVDVLGDATFDAGGDLSTGGTIEGANVYLTGDDLYLDGSITATAGNVNAYAYGDLYQYGSITASNNVNLGATYDLYIYGDVTAGNDLRVTGFGGEGDSDIYIDGNLTAGGNLYIDNQTNGDIVLYSNATLIADSDGDDPGAYLDIYGHGFITASEGATLHVGGADSRTGYVTIYTDGENYQGQFAIDFDGDIDAGSIEITAGYGSVGLGGTVAADESITIYAYEDFVLSEGGLISGAENRAEDMPKPSGVVVYASYDLPPGVSIAAGDVDIQGQIVSGDIIAIGAYNVSGGEVTIGGVDNGLGTGFTLSNDEFQNLSADSIVILAGNGTGYSGESGGYDLHIGDLTIDAENVDDVWFGTQENILVEGEVTPVGEGVNVHLGFVLAYTAPDDFAQGVFPIGFVPENIYISGSLGSADSMFGSVTLVAQGDILMGSQAFIDAAIADPEFSAAEQGDALSPEEGHIFIASEVLQMATPGGRILTQDTAEGVDFGGLIIGLPQVGQELIFIPDQLDDIQIGGPTDGYTMDFSSGPSQIELYGYFVGENGETITGFHAAGVDNLLDPDLLVGEYYINNCQFYAEQCGSGGEGDIPVFHDPYIPVDPQLDPSDVLSFFTGFPFEEVCDDDNRGVCDDDAVEIQGEPVTGSGNEDLWTIKPTGVRP